MYDWIYFDEGCYWTGFRSKYISNWHFLWESSNHNYCQLWCSSNVNYHRQAISSCYRTYDCFHELTQPISLCNFQRHSETATKNFSVIHCPPGQPPLLYWTEPLDRRCQNDQIHWFGPETIYSTASWSSSITTIGLVLGSSKWMNTMTTAHAGPWYIVCTQGMTRLLQPQDIGISTPFKDQLKSQYTPWLLAHVGIESIFAWRPKPIREQIAQWIQWSLENIDSDTIKNAFNVFRPASKPAIIPIAEGLDL